MPLSIIRDDITRMKVDAIVNAASSSLKKSGGVCSDIFNAAGESQLQNACGRIGRCENGNAVATEGFALSKYIIHTVGPAWQGGSNGERDILYACYRNSLTLARKLSCESVAFPLISSGVNGYPNEKALRVAVKAIGDFLLTDDMEVSLVITGDTGFSLHGKRHSSIQSFIKNNYTETHHGKISQSEFESLRNAIAPNMQSGKPQSAGMFDMLDMVRDGSRAAFARNTEEARRVTQRRLEEIVGRPGETFQQMLLRLIGERHERYPKERNADVWRRANITRGAFSDIWSRQNHRPTKNTVICLALSLELSLDVTLDLLARLSYAFSPSSYQDLIVQYFINEGTYDVHVINETLFEHGQELLGTKAV